MKIISLLVLTYRVLAELDLNFFQNDYRAVPEWAEVVSYDKFYVKHYSARAFKHNRTCTAINNTFAFNVDLGTNVEVILQAYKFMSNEYRYFPVRMEVNFCKASKANVYGIGKFKCGNFTGCPLLKGRIYHVCNWTPDDSKLPPFVPTGKYMVEFQALYFSREIGRVRFYVTVTRPEVKK